MVGLPLADNFNQVVCMDLKMSTHLQPATSNEIIRRNMNAMHSARQNFIEAESSERIRHALHHNVRTYADE